MTVSAPATRHPSIYLLGDHLDAALAMGEDLLTEKVALADAAQPLTMARLVRQNRELAAWCPKRVTNRSGAARRAARSFRTRASRR